MSAPSPMVPPAGCGDISTEDATPRRPWLFHGRRACAHTVNPGSSACARTESADRGLRPSGLRPARLGNQRPVHRSSRELSSPPVLHQGAELSIDGRYWAIMVRFETML